LIKASNLIFDIYLHHLINSFDNDEHEFNYLIYGLNSAKLETIDSICVYANYPNSKFYMIGDDIGFEVIDNYKVFLSYEYHVDFATLINDRYYKYYTILQNQFNTYLKITKSDIEHFSMIYLARWNFRGEMISSIPI
jgi:hypothetical protein